MRRCDSSAGSNATGNESPGYTCQRPNAQTNRENIPQSSRHLEAPLLPSARGILGVILIQRQLVAFCSSETVGRWRAEVHKSKSESVRVTHPLFDFPQSRRYYFLVPAYTPTEAGAFGLLCRGSSEISKRGKGLCKPIRGPWLPHHQVPRLRPRIKGFINILHSQAVSTFENFLFKQCVMR